VLGRARGESEVAARALGVRLQAMEVRAPHEFMSAFAAIQLPGIVRIALVGSLATEKPEPKDVDLLIPSPTKQTWPRLRSLPGG
jgi:predicted nucleotidyltransferase